MHKHLDEIPGQEEHLGVWVHPWCGHTTPSSAGPQSLRASS
jgi:hypothetical protein